tara:strand:+ start:230 stop:565 length:336 start_codon:yes stop_codon:yes gene_type:complete
MKAAHYNTLTNPNERTRAHFAALARANTIHGGATALTLAKRAERMGSPNDPVSVVSDVFGASTGRHHHAHEAWECRECGQSYLGQDATAQCCAAPTQWETGWNATEEGSEA